MQLDLEIKELLGETLNDETDLQCGRQCVFTFENISSICLSLVNIEISASLNIDDFKGETLFC